MVRVDIKVDKIQQTLRRFADGLRAQAIDGLLLPVASDIQREQRTRVLDTNIGATGGMDMTNAAIKDNQPATIKAKLKNKQTWRGFVKSGYATGKLLNLKIYRNDNFYNPYVRASVVPERVDILNYIADKGYKNLIGIPSRINGVRWHEYAFQRWAGYAARIWRESVVK